MNTQKQSPYGWQKGTKRTLVSIRETNTHHYVYTQTLCQVLGEKKDAVINRCKVRRICIHCKGLDCVYFSVWGHWRSAAAIAPSV